MQVNFSLFNIEVQMEQTNKGNKMKTKRDNRHLTPYQIKRIFGFKVKKGSNYITSTFKGAVIKITAVKLNSVTPTGKRQQVFRTKVI